ncbi:hypothetical protein FRC12_010608 [Ceratobasidium sp. 428]|nr:hypothetical protein FRC12_010608 [Ceratobasidium sp. 428]
MDPPMTMTTVELNAAERAEAERRRDWYYDDPDDDGYVSPPPPSSNSRPPRRTYYCDRREYDYVHDESDRERGTGRDGKTYYAPARHHVHTPPSNPYSNYSHRLTYECRCAGIDRSLRGAGQILGRDSSTRAGVRTHSHVIFTLFFSLPSARRVVCVVVREYKNVSFSLVSHSTNGNAACSTSLKNRLQSILILNLPILNYQHPSLIYNSEAYCFSVA